MEVGIVKQVDIDGEMQQAYLDYAMSVIVARALPDARDGLKPVHRRILYAMYDMGLRPDSAYKKSARIVGEVLGKYHPHGDMAVYDAMARMAQDFSMRYLLVDGQGNFGSVDGDPPAAMRYTEARLGSVAFDMLADIQKNTVDFDGNFDSTLTEPSVLPAALPNLLINGATGIAVGMATSIPPHNLGEVVDALRFMLENWEKLDDINVEDLMQFVKGPDFPTGGIILQESGEEGLAGAYGSGRGRVTIQASAHLEEMERGRNRIIVTELPYMTNKSSLIERIADLTREERLQGIVDLRDESDRQGMRIVIELSKAADPEKVLRDLYKHTPMRDTFSIIMLALVDGEPRLLSLKQALRVYLEHRLEIVRRRSKFDYERARQRAHILEGLRVALKNLDEVISIIRKAPDVETARVRLEKRFKLSEIQAQAILDMPLRRLAALERKKIEDEYKEIQALIKELESLLRSPKKMRQVISEELLGVKEAYGDRRRTQIIHLKDGEPKVSLLTKSELTPEKTVWLAITPDGLISRSLEDRLPRLSGREAPAWLLQASTRDTLYLVCEQGEAAAIPVHTIPETDQPSAGTAVSKVAPLREGSRLAALFALDPKERVEDRFVVTATRQGMVKKSALSELPGPSASTFTLVKVNEGDRLGWLRISDGKSEILMVTAGGMAIRFSEDEVRAMGLVAAGVMGIKLQENDEAAGMDLLPQPGDVFLVASDGSAKRVAVDQFSVQGRYGQGLLAWKLPDKVQVVGMAIGKGKQRAILHLEKLAPKMIRLDEAPLLGRTARGHVIQEVKGGDRVVGLTLPQGQDQFGDAASPQEDEGGSKKRKSSKAQASPPSAGLTTSGETDGAGKLKAAGARPVQGKSTKRMAEKSSRSSNARPKKSGESASPARGKAAVQLELPQTSSRSKKATGADKMPADKGQGKKKAVEASAPAKTSARAKTADQGQTAAKAGARSAKAPASAPAETSARAKKAASQDQTPEKTGAPGTKTANANKEPAKTSTRATKTASQGQAPAKAGTREMKTATSAPAKTSARPKKSTSQDQARAKKGAGGSRSGKASAQGKATLPASGGTSKPSARSKPAARATGDKAVAGSRSTSRSRASATPEKKEAEKPVARSKPAKGPDSAASKPGTGSKKAGAQARGTSRPGTGGKKKAGG